MGMDVDLERSRVLVEGVLPATRITGGFPVKGVLPKDRVKVLDSKMATRGSRVSRKSAYSKVRQRLGEIQEMSRCSDAIV